MAIWGWIFSFFLGSTALGVLLTNFSPQEGHLWIVPAVYSALFVFLYGFVGLAGYTFRIRFFKSAGRNEMIRTSARQGVLIGVMSVGVLTLLAQNLFNWWSAGLLLIIFVLLEIYAR